MNTPNQHPNADTLMNATLISSALAERNIWNQIVSSATRSVKNMLNFKKNRELADLRMQQLQMRTHLIQQYIESNQTSRQHVGHRINRLR